MEFPTETLKFGFVNGPGGQHNSRTIMLAELRLLLAACTPSTTFEEYRAAIVDDNVLLKKTMSTRQKSLRGLRELYSLDRSVVLFRALRDLWDYDQEAQPLLALLCAVARDPILRGTAAYIVDTPPGTPVTAQMLAEAADESLPGRYNRDVLSRIGRNVASSWEQSGHLRGHTNKVRARAESKPAALAYALLLGHLCDARGEGLFHTLWSRLLDAPINILQAQAVAASQRGWIEYLQSGNVIEVGFRHLLRQEERSQ